MPPLVDQILDRLLPPRCVLCNSGLTTGSFCGGCLADLPWLEPAPDARLRAALQYEYPVDRLVAAAKFQRQLWAARALGELLARALARHPPPAAPEHLVPVPLHRGRLRERGYNQALEIARPVAGAQRLALAPQLCQRLRATPQQSGLSAAARRRNLRGAFAVPTPLAGARLAVVDDVITTGSTAAAVVRALVAAGAADVQVWAVALTPAGRPRGAQRKV
jgi:ComF family protein